METTINSLFLRSVLILVLTVVTAFPSGAYDFMENGLAYNINEDGISVQVTYQRSTSSGYSNLTGDLVIPSSVYHNGIKYPVTSIGDLAFFRCSGLTSVVIPNSVTKICFKAFMECTGLTSVDIPGSVTEIGNSAFYGCLNLSSLHVPGSVESIGALAFMSCCGLSLITVDESNAFYDSRDNCNAIVETATNTLVLGSNSTIIPNSIESIGMYAFVNCNGLESVVIPNSVTEIGKSAFHACSGLTSLTIGNSVTTIGETAISYCYGLETVFIPKSVVSIGNGAFSYCSGLSTLIVEGENPYYDSRDDCNAIIETENNKLIAGCKNTVIPNTITSIDDFAFYGCNDLKSLTIPNSVLSIGKNAFYGCRNMTSVTIPNSVVSIGVSAFSSCDGLKSLIIGSSVTSIGTGAFTCGSALSSITCKIKEPQNITYGDSYHIFKNASSLNGVDTETCILKVPMGSLETYRSRMPWSEFANIVVEGDVNNDEAVTAADVTEIYNILLDSSREVPSSYDVDGDGEVTSADITAIYNVILGEQK